MSNDTNKVSIDVGSDVVARDGTHLGTVGYIVVRPPHFEMTDIVVTTGQLLGRDIVVPIDHVSDVQDGTVKLTIDKQEFAGLDDYIEAHYDRPPDDWFAAPGMYYPGSATLWPAGSYIPVPTSVGVNAPAGTVGLREGMEVESSDGHKVGTVHSVRTDEASENVTGFVVKHGFLLTHDTEVPISDVKDVDDDRVVLRLSREDVEKRFEG